MSKLHKAVNYDIDRLQKELSEKIESKKRLFITPDYMGSRFALLSEIAALETQLKSLFDLRCAAEAGTLLHY